ncbi:MAG: hypothetical protein U0183_15805 [Polyangiaceae bacterium]|mgnify:CR=1 FL=1|jgi:hypothetical protein
MSHDPASRLADKIAALEAELGTLEERRRRSDELTAHVALVETELRESRRVLATLEATRTKAKRRLTTLDDLAVASPCEASWSSMVGDDKVRFCGDCRKNVYNLTAMTRDEAIATVHDREGEVCVRFYQRADGTVLTADCPVGERKRRRQKLAAAILVGMGVASTMAAFAWVMVDDAPEPVPPPPAVIAIPTVEATSVPEPLPPPTARPIMGGAALLGHETPEAPPKKPPPPHVKMGKMAR